jgi:hypothetical protein
MPWEHTQSPAFFNTSSLNHHHQPNLIRKPHNDKKKRESIQEILQQENCAAENIEFQKKISHENGPAKGIKPHQEISNCAAKQQTATHLTRKILFRPQNHEISSENLMNPLNLGSRRMKSYIEIP